VARSVFPAIEGVCNVVNVQVSGAGVLPALLDLDVIDASERAAAWRGGARAYFPGLSVRDLCLKPSLGTISGARFGPGHLWSILSPPLEVFYDPSTATIDQTHLFSLMLQLRGATLARQEGRSSMIGPGDMCVIDSRLPFELSVDGVLSHFIVLQMPRLAVLSRNPSLERRTAEAFDTADAGTLLLRSLVLNSAESAPSLRDEQRGSALASVIQLLGALHSDRQAEVNGSSWRSQAALSFIDSCLADPELTATGVADAQGVSRRRLDQIMVEATGVSVSAQIWLRRLEQAANDLLDPRFAAKTVTQIAFAAGFEDVAHFTRAFKRRYRMPPREWRNRGSAASVTSAASTASVARNPGAVDT
jgi:AraC family transcriptional regulator, positive regulator of tynA and feaB